jgi:hypothetical protein
LRVWRRTWARGSYQDLPAQISRSRRAAEWWGWLGYDEEFNRRPRLSQCQSTTDTPHSSRRITPTTVQHWDNGKRTSQRRRWAISARRCTKNLTAVWMRLGGAMSGLGIERTHLYGQQPNGPSEPCAGRGGEICSARAKAAPVLTTRGRRERWRFGPTAQRPHESTEHASTVPPIGPTRQWASAGEESHWPRVPTRQRVGRRGLARTTVEELGRAQESPSGPNWVPSPGKVVFSFSFIFCFISFLFSISKFEFWILLGVSPLGKIYKFKSHYRNNIFYYIYFYYSFHPHNIVSFFFSKSLNFL